MGYTRRYHCNNSFVGKYVTSNQMYIVTYWNLFIETKQYLVMIMVLIFASTFTFLDFAEFSQFVSSNIYVKNDFFQTCFLKSAKGKWPHGMSGNIRFSSKSKLFNWIYYNLFVFSVKSIHFTGGMLLCLHIYIYSKCTIYPICPIYPIYYLTISYYFLFFPTIS